LLDNGSIVEATVTPADARLATHDGAALTGGDPAHNAAALLALLDGAPGAYRDIVLLNTAGALIVAGRASDWADGAAQAAHAIDSGAARTLLDRWKAFQ
jgi:anthranilate phosphoribosyltransferase